ncbi:hypothetical protein BMS3Abin17_01284 [archaeon BMS3Abin17]|nr:hypothetical protein BMS3Abin17_01284 [archaeon BMS3Abin17]HDZ61260.1 hypothetical protein [Candidatus Pacearchaeota archaeon]
MFKKKTCRRCGEKTSNKHRFCSNCGYPINKSSNDEDWGLLGKDDNSQNVEDPFSMPFGGISGKMINKMFGSMMNMLEKEMTKEFSKTNSQPSRKIPQRTNIRLMINGKEINLNNIENQAVQAKKQVKTKVKKPLILSFSQENLKKFSKLQKQEPLTDIRRLSNKVIYEINMPEVKSIKDVSIMRLENSIEIKAVGKNKAYFKLIPISLPITDYNISKGKLILELSAGE